MATIQSAWVPSALKNASAASGSNGGDSQAGASTEEENGGRPSPVPAAAAAAADGGGGGGGGGFIQLQPTRSTASLAFPSVPSVAPAYAGGSTASTIAGSGGGGGAVSPTPPFIQPAPLRPAFSSPTASGATAAAANRHNHPDPNPFARRGSSVASERASVLEREASEARAALETANRLTGDVAVVEAQALGAERQLEAVREAILHGRPHRGKSGAALDAEEERLARKETLLREKEVLLREERLVFLRKSQNARPPGFTQRRGSDGSARQQKRVSFIMRHTVNDPEEEKAEQQTVLEVEDMIRRQSISAGSISEVDDDGLAAAIDNSSVIHVHKLEEDPRLLVRMEAFNLPILVATLLSGFTLVLFDVAKTLLARRLAVLAFALQTSSSTVLCLIAFRGQQLYSYATSTKPLLRPFLQRMCQVQVLSLILFSLGVVAFVISFVVEASDEMGDPWLATLALILLPTILAAVLFAASTQQVRRHSFPPTCAPPAPDPGPRGGRAAGVPGE